MREFHHAAFNKITIAFGKSQIAEQLARAGRYPLAQAAALRLRGRVKGKVRCPRAVQAACKAYGEK